MIANDSLTSLCSKTIIDLENNVLGRVIDAILHYENLELCGLVITRSAIDDPEEVKESEEQILPIDYIKDIKNDGVYLNASVNQINTVRCEEMENKDEVLRFKDLIKLRIYSENNDDVGRIEDLIFLDKVFIQMKINPQYFNNLAPRYSPIEGLMCGANIDELDISNVDIRIKVSDREIERRIKLVMDSDFEKLYLEPALLKRSEGELRIRRLRNLMSNIS
ncbi:MAG: hypothetical protein GPJ54_15315 [Candidatus Heimdallarchaeota archaeon]|nr:hypothetical protein [Candidatus Heimdallarchaeota archaeon]